MSSVEIARMQEENEQLQAEVDRLREQVVDWQPIEPHDIQVGMRLKVTDPDGVTYEFTVRGSKSSGRMSIFNNLDLGLSFYDNTWFADPRTVPETPQDSQVERVARSLAASHSLTWDDLGEAERGEWRVHAANALKAPERGTFDLERLREEFEELQAEADRLFEQVVDWRPIKSRFVQVGMRVRVVSADGSTREFLVGDRSGAAYFAGQNPYPVFYDTGTNEWFVDPRTLPAGVGESLVGGKRVDTVAQSLAASLHVVWGGLDETQRNVWRVHALNAMDAMR